MKTISSLLFSMLLFILTDMGALSQVTFSGTELLGRPTDRSVTVNVVPDADIGHLFYEFGVSPGVYTARTDTTSATANNPHETVIAGLLPDTKYYYRMNYSTDGGATWTPGEEHHFRTQRAQGSAFTFTIVSDSHLGQYGGQTTDELALYEQTLQNVEQDNPDFHIDLGDTYAMDPSPLGTGMTEEEARNAYMVERPFLGKICHSIPFFQCLGNHENEEGWNFDDTFAAPDQSLAIVGMKYRKLLYPTPVPDSFYSGNDDPLTIPVAGDTNHEDYYSWQWGDALFVVLDPFHYSMVWPSEGNSYGGEGMDGEAGGDRWDWTLGIKQYLWLKSILENSTATYKFVFMHLLPGGNSPYGRGGIKAAPLFEWGGNNADGTWGFTQERPAAEGWDLPIHQLLVKNKVSAVFHGHDHIYASEELDGIVYLECPKPDDAGYTWEPYGYGYIEDHYPDAVMIENSGHIRVTVTPEEVKTEYVRSYLQGDGENGIVAHSVTMKPPYTGPTFNLTLAADPESGGATIPSAGTHSVPANRELTVCALPSRDYVFDFWTGDVADADSDTTTIMMDADKTVTAHFRYKPGCFRQEGAVSIAGADDVSAISVNHSTGKGLNRLMLAGISWNGDTQDPTILSGGVTFSYGSASVKIAMEHVITQVSGTSGRYAAIYSLLNPPADVSGKVEIAFSGTVTAGIVAGVVNFTGVDPATPLGNPGGANGTGTAPGVTLTGLTGDEIVFDNLFQGSSGSTQILTIGSGQESLWNELVANVRAASSTEKAAGNPVTMSWTAADSRPWAIVAVPVKPFNELLNPSLEIDLTGGWNIFSTSRLPCESDLKEVVKTLIADGSLVKIQDETGYSLEDHGIFGGWQNNIGNISHSEGYKIKVTRDCSLIIPGALQTYPFKIPLRAGWNIIGFPSNTEAAALSVVQQLIDRGTLIKVQDEKGNSIEDWGVFGGWKNNIGNFAAGEGYKVKVNADDTLTVSESYLKSGMTVSEDNSSDACFYQAPATNGLDHMNINVAGLSAIKLKPGIEIAVYDGSLCVGAVTLLQKHLVSGTVSIPVSASEGMGSPGFTEGHPFTLVVRDTASDAQCPAETEIIKGTGTFRKHESTFVRLKISAAKGAGNNIRPDGKYLNIYPNPTTGKVYFHMGSPTSKRVHIQVINACGQKIMDRYFNTAQGEIDLSGNTSGLYTILLTGDSGYITEKIVLMK